MYQQLLNHGKYEELLTALINDQSEEACYYRFCALFGLKRYQEIITFAADYVHQSQHFYYEIMVIFIRSLIELEQYEKALDLVKEELKMPYIPRPFNDFFNEMNAIIAKKMYHSSHKTDPLLVAQDYQLNELLLSSQEQDVIIAVIHELSRRNIRPFIPTIPLFLNDEKRPNFLKVMFFEILADQGYNETISTKVNGVIIKTNACDLTPLLEQYCIVEIMKIITTHETKNSSIIDVSKATVIAYLASIYPLSAEEDEYSLIGAASYAIALEKLGMQPNLLQLSIVFNVKVAFLEKYYSDFKFLELSF